MSVINVVALVLALIAIGYLVWWGRRFAHARRARQLAASIVGQGEWSPDVIEQVLEYARLLDPLSAEFAGVCIGLAHQNVADPRARALFERYLSIHRVASDNEIVARRFAQITSVELADTRRAVDVGNAMAVLDRLSEFHLSTEDDTQLRARFAVAWVDVSPPAIEACLTTWRLLRGSPDAGSSLRFLFDYFTVVWDTRPDRRENKFVAGAAEVFCARADIPPTSLDVRRRAIEAAYLCGDYSTCFVQCDRARFEFGASALDDAVWQMWGQSIVHLEGSDWTGFAEGRFAHLPPGTRWEQLVEVLNRAVALQPDDSDLLGTQAWTCIGAKQPVDQALPVYRRVLDRRLPIAPVLYQLVEYYYQNRAWADLERASRALLQLQSGQPADRTARQLAEALIEGHLTPDGVVFERVFDVDTTYPALNEQIGLAHLQKPELDSADLNRIDRLLSSPLPATSTHELRQALREKFLLAGLDNPGHAPASLSLHAGHYLESGGQDVRVMQWAVETGAGNEAVQLATLEALVRQRPVERRHYVILADRYAASGATDDQMAALAQAAESDWSSRPRFDRDDCRVALLVGQRVPLAAQTRRKLLNALISDQPAGWREAAARYLSEALAERQTDVDLLLLVVNRLFAATDREPLHVWTLETLADARDEPVVDGLRLLALYDAGVGRPGESGDETRRKGETLAEKLAARCRKALPQLRADLFAALLRRTVQKDVTTLADWEIDLFLFGLKDNLVPNKADYSQFAERLAGMLAARGDTHAVAVQRWVYEHGKRKSVQAARLFEMARRLGQTKTGDAFWFNVAREARAQSDVAESATEFLADHLLALKKWDKDHLDVARDLLDSLHRKRLASRFVERVEYGRDRNLDRAVLELLDESPTLGKGRADLLSALADRREKRHDYDGALEACFLIEESVGSSEDLTRRVLTLLPNSRDRARHADRAADYLKRYPTSFDLLAQMATLARDSARPLGFDLAYQIVDRWSDLAGRQSGAGSTDPSFVAIVKCDIYDLYRDQLEPREAQMMLRSIGKHSRQALSDEARKRIEQIGDEVLFSSGQDNETREVVAEVLYGLGNLAAATWQFEQLAEVPDFRHAAIESLERIARQLESPRRELAALLTTYRCIAQDAYQAGQLDAAETTLEKAKAILMDETALETLNEADRKRLVFQRDAILKLHQTLLEGQRAKGELDVERLRDLADIYRLRALWDRAGKLYTDLANALHRRSERAAALENASMVFDCYYKAGKGWWEPAARYLLYILWQRETVPPLETVREFGALEFGLMENVAVLYHSLYVDPNLHLDRAKRLQFKRNADELYSRLPIVYIQQNDHVRRLQEDLSQLTPTILEPFDLVPQVRGRPEIWTSTRYERLERIGEGEFAEVFKVKDTETGQIYAMKIITPAKGRDPQAVERFQREGQWLKELDHPNIVKCHDVGVQEDRHFIVMDYVDGPTLESLITQRRRHIPLEQRLRIFLRLWPKIS